jgi:hypothetical protein
MEHWSSTGRVSKNKKGDITAWPVPYLDISGCGT